MTEVTLESGKKAIVAKSGIILLSPSGNTLVTCVRLQKLPHIVAKAQKKAMICVRHLIICQI